MKVFISYSRRDAHTADRLVADLEERSIEVLIDRRDLPYGEEWQPELAALIRKSDTVIWLVSKSSVRSHWCNWELGEVQRTSKRLVPVRIDAAEPADLPENLGRIHILPAEGKYDPSVHLDALIAALEADRAWIEAHTRYADRAADWIGHGRAGSTVYYVAGHCTTPKLGEIGAVPVHRPLEVRLPTYYCRADGQQREGCGNW